MKRLWNAVRVAAVFVFLIVIAGNVYFLAARVWFHQEAPELFRFSQAVVMSGSMEPELSVGDMVLIRREEEYHAGEIITFSDGGSPTTHRILEETPEGFVTKGDANNVPDGGIVHPGMVYGRVALIIPKLGSAALFLRTPAGWTVLFVLAAALLFGKDVVPRLSKTERNG